jgi:hypothetical protein
MKRSFFVMSFVLTMNLHAQVVIQSLNLREYAFAADSARIQIPQIANANDTATLKINRQLLNHTFIADSSMWPDVFTDSTFSRIHDSCKGIHYNVMHNRNNLLVINIHSDFWYEPYPQDEILWFNTKTGNVIQPFEMFTSQGLNMLKDSMQSAVRKFKRENRKLIRQYYRGFPFDECVSNPEYSIYFISIDPEKTMLTLGYHCSITMSCDPFGPNGIWLIDKQKIPLYILPEWATLLK